MDTCLGLQCYELVGFADIKSTGNIVVTSIDNVQTPICKLVEYSWYNLLSCDKYR